MKNFLNAAKEILSNRKAQASFVAGAAMLFVGCGTVHVRPFVYDVEVVEPVKQRHVVYHTYKKPRRVEHHYVDRPFYRSEKVIIVDDRRDHHHHNNHHESRPDKGWYDRHGNYHNSGQRHDRYDRKAKKQLNND